MKSADVTVLTRVGRTGRAACIALGAVLLAASPGNPASAAEDYVPFPQPKYQVRVERDHMVAMRDGVRLATDLYFPIAAGRRLPVIVIRTQYDKSEYFQSEDRYYHVARVFAGQGYVVAAQDIRGRFASQGEYRLAKHDAVDGYDTIEWLAKQPWSNGKVASYGCSSLGITQIFHAQLRPPHLAAMVPQASGGATRAQLWDVITAGVPEIGWALEWFRTDGDWLKGPPVQQIDYQPILETLPVRDMARKAGSPPSDWENWVTHPVEDPWWDQFMFFDDDSTADVPALFVNSWNDLSTGETLYLFNKFRENARSVRARRNQYVVISPTDHCESEFVGSNLKFGGRDLGDPRKDFWSLYLRWFDRWLRGNERALAGLPHVQYYVMGKNEWRSAEQWPPPGVQYTKFYLHSAGRANSRFGDGVLLADPSSAARDEYVYDPATPVPTKGMTAPGSSSYEQSDIEMRHDVLVYTSTPLERGIEVSGPIEVVLYVSSSARDTDFTAKLVDVHPDGRAFEIRSSITRARYREGFDKTVFLTPGAIVPLRIRLQDTSNYFAAGHRVRLDISSSNSPRFARNLNTGGNGYDETAGVAARNTVHHGRDSASHIVLPIVRGQ